MGNIKSKNELLIDGNDLLVDFFKSPSIERWKTIRNKDKIYELEFGKKSYKLFLYYAHTKHFYKSNIPKPYTDDLKFILKIDDLLYQRRFFKLKHLYELVLLYWASGNKDFINKIKFLSKKNNQSFIVQNTAFYLYEAYLKHENIENDNILLEKI
jgi:hypothetical protein